MAIGSGWLSRLFAAVGLASSTPSQPAQEPPLDAMDDLWVQSQSQTDAVQNFHSFLPLINQNNPTTAPLGEKPVFQTLLPDSTLLATALEFSTAQIQHVQAVIDTEKTAIAALEAQANGIIGDGQKSLQEKQAAIAAMDYNGQLRMLLRGSQDELRQQLGTTAYGQVVEWFHQEWQRLLIQRATHHSAANSASVAVDAPCPTFTVFATRSTYTDYSADLPDQYIKLANQGIEYSHGYTNTTVYSITVQLGTEILSGLVITDVAPWNHDDNYWNTNSDPLHPRRLFTDLPQGVPEAEAAYFDNYNNGLNQFGQVVTNPAGVNLSETAARQIGMVGNQWVSVTFPWDCIRTTPTSHPIERSWGGANDWSQSEAHLVNPVTGNQSLWARDLYVSAPGLPVDIVRYYNSLDGADGIFGTGWSSEFDMRVYPQTDGRTRYATWTASAPSSAPMAAVSWANQGSLTPLPLTAPALC
ncbi:MAG: DUF6531 domain-containing protein [Caldilineaceae bacterium]